MVLALFGKIPQETTAIILSGFAGYLTREMTGINREIHQNGGSITVPKGSTTITVTKEEDQGNVK